MCRGADAVVQKARFEITQLRERVFAHRPGSVSGALQRAVVNRDEVSVACEMQIGFDERRAQLDRSFKSGKRVLRRMA